MKCATHKCNHYWIICCKHVFNDNTIIIFGLVSGVDFQPLHEVVSFGVGEIHKDVIVNIINDEWVEPTEQFIVQLKSMDDMSIIRKTTVTIKDDDSKCVMV